MRSARVALGLVAGASACLFPSLDALTGDAGTTDDATANDAPANDAPANDAETPDTMPDAGPFCPQSGAVLCSDFDELDAASPWEWGYAYTPGATVVQASSAFSVSPPRALLVSTDNTNATAGLTTSIGYNGGFTLSFDLRIEALGDNPGVCSLSIGNDQLDLQPQTTSTDLLEGTQLADGGSSYSSSSTATVITLATWTSVSLDVDRATRQAVVSLNGTMVINRTVGIDWATAVSASVALGIGDSSSETVYYDNVTIRTR